MQIPCGQYIDTALKPCKRFPKYVTANFEAMICIDCFVGEFIQLDAVGETYDRKG